MAHYALLDNNNIVVQVITGHDENYSNTDWEKYYSEVTGYICKRTSYWTGGGIHWSETGEPSTTQEKAFRKNYAGIGFIYDESRDAFIPPQPYPSWILDEETCRWKAPINRPNIDCIWNENAVSWDCP